MDGSLVFRCEMGVSGAVISSADAAAAEVNAGLFLFFFTQTHLFRTGSNWSEYFETVNG